jgi:GT2 family glycosyltransferase
MALRRDLALRVGGFDPRLDAGTLTRSGGDTDMFARMLDAGQQIAYRPDALVWHRHRREMHELNDCIFGYGVGLYSFLTRRLLEQHDYGVPIIAGRWFVGPLVKAAWRRLRGRPAVSWPLLLREAGGALLGPWFFWRATKHWDEQQIHTEERFGLC